MKNIPAFLLGLVFVASVFGSPVRAEAAELTTLGLTAKTAIGNVTSVDDLKMLLKYLKTQIKAVKKNKSSNSTGSSSASLENLTIDSVRLSLPAGIGSGAGIPVADQKITVVVKNNAYGSYQLSGKKFKYAIYLYDVTGSKKKVSKAATGEALVPYANGYSEFSAFIEGGMPFDGTHYDKDYRAMIEIDTEDSVDESNEKDNTGWSDAWHVDFYKG